MSTIAEALAGISRGYYEEADAFLRSRAQGTGAQSATAALALARVELATGRYREAERTAARAAAHESLRVEAETLRAEALLALGRLDDAERALEIVASVPTALRANVILGRLLVERGRDAEATSRFMRLIEAFNDGTIGERDGEGLLLVAMAAWGLHSVQDANDAFRDAAASDADRTEIQLEWARLFLEKYDAGHAEESVRQALSRNPNEAVAHALMARIHLAQSLNFTAATAYVERALEIDPSLVMAHVTLAGMALRDMDIEAADGHLRTALAVNPNALEALSLRAAVRFLADDEGGFREAKQAVFQRNRGYSRMYSIIGEYADWEHRYPEIVQMAREAVTLSPEDADAHATLGLNLLRMGDEQEGLLALREAWRRDRFNVRVFNTLNLYDDVISQEYEELVRPPFIFRMHRQERPILERYLPPMFERAYESMRRRYGMRPEGPIRVELFSNHEHFSVRTAGLPNLGVQGVCFGKVVTALSPRGGPFNWGQITWHELAHVFHIQLSENHVPRWFTEGLAEYETIIARPEWRREQDRSLWQALAEDRLPPLRSMNRAFTHARSAQDMMDAYYASSQLVVYIVDRFGFDRVPNMLRKWAQGDSTEEVIQRVLGINIDELDRDFRAHSRRRLSPRYENDFSLELSQYRDLDALRASAEGASSDADAQAKYAAGLLLAGQADASRQAAERALQLLPTHALARYVMVRITVQQEEGEAAERHLRALLSSGRDGYHIRLLAARAARTRSDAAAVRQHLEEAVRIDPDGAEAWQGLLAIAESVRDTDLKLRALERLAFIDQHSREAWVAWVEALAVAQRTDDLIPAAESAIYVDPYNAELHRLLGEGYLRAARPREALAELDVALLAAPEQSGPVHMARARALLALGRRAEARAAADEAVRANPELEGEAGSIVGPR